MSENINDRIKAKLLEVFKYALSFFEEHNLHYVACGGTVLGAVRHNGFIPWDDDIDIYMPREDYDRLLLLRSELVPHGYDIQSLNDKGYFLPFAKFIDARTTFWEKKDFPFVSGFFIDIFPLDKFDCPDKEIKSVQSKAKRLFRRYQTTLKSCSNKVLFKYFYELRWITLVIGVQTRLKSNTSQKYLEKFIKNERNYAGGKGDKSICVTQWKGRVFRTEWFEKPVKHVFADIQINIPSDYDTYLKLLYGDYMQLPAENKRTGGHKPYYMNFEKSMTVEEINQLPQMQQQ